MAAHIATLLLDDYIGFSLVDVFVPGASGYARVATAIGVLAFWLLAIGVSNRLRRVLPYATWRRIHLLNFAVWVLALAQGIFEGTDTGTIWATAAYAVATSAVAGAVAWRFLRPRTSKSGPCSSGRRPRPWSRASSWSPSRSSASVRA